MSEKPTTFIEQQLNEVLERYDDLFDEAEEIREERDRLRAENNRLRTAMKQIVSGSEYLIEIGVMEPDFIFAAALEKAKSALFTSERDGE